MTTIAGGWSESKTLSSVAVCSDASSSRKQRLQSITDNSKTTKRKAKQEMKAAVVAKAKELVEPAAEKATQDAEASARCRVPH